VDGSLLYGRCVDGARLDELTGGRNSQQRDALFFGQHRGTGIECGCYIITPILLDGAFQCNNRVGAGGK